MLNDCGKAWGEATAITTSAFSGDKATGNSRLKVRKPSANNEIVFPSSAARLLPPHLHIHAPSNCVFRLSLPTKYTYD
jgi:hypothetical protein